MDATVAHMPLEGRFVGREHHFPVRVYFEDTDVSGVVYHANYLRYMERARSAMLRAAGVDQRAVFEGGGGVYAIRDLTIRYAAPAKLDDLLTVVSRLATMRPASVVIQQRVMRASVILTRAQVEAAFVAPSGRPRRQPGDWVRAFEHLVWQGEQGDIWN